MSDEPEPRYVNTERPILDWTADAVGFNLGNVDITAFTASLPTIEGMEYASGTLTPYGSPEVERLAAEGLTVIVDRKTKSKRHPIVYGHVSVGPMAGTPVLIDHNPTRWRRLRQWARRRK